MTNRSTSRANILASQSRMHTIASSSDVVTAQASGSACVCIHEPVDTIDDVRCFDVGHIIDEANVSRITPIRHSSPVRSRNSQPIQVYEIAHELKPVIDAGPHPDPDDEMLELLDNGRIPDETKEIVLSQFWQHVATMGLNGEESTTFRFTSRYHSLLPRHKIRLLEITGLDRIAYDLLSDCFRGLSRDDQINLLKCSPVQKHEIAQHIAAQHFRDMSQASRLEFLNIAPRKTLHDMLDRHLDWLTISEALVAASRLRERHFKEIRERIGALVWNEREKCDSTDLLGLGHIILPTIGRDLLTELHMRIVASPTSTMIAHQTVFALCFQVGSAECRLDSMLIGKGPIVPLSFMKTESHSLGLHQLNVKVHVPKAKLRLVILQPLGSNVYGRIRLETSQNSCIIGCVTDDLPLIDLTLPTVMQVDHQEMCCTLSVDVIREQRVNVASQSLLSSPSHRYRNSHCRRRRDEDSDTIQQCIALKKHNSNSIESSSFASSFTSLSTRSLSETSSSHGLPAINDEFATTIEHEKMIPQKVVIIYDPSMGCQRNCEIRHEIQLELNDTFESLLHRACLLFKQYDPLLSPSQSILYDKDYRICDHYHDVDSHLQQSTTSSTLVNNVFYLTLINTPH